MMFELVTTRCDDIKMVAFADDFSAAGKITSLLHWWTTLLEIGLEILRTTLNLKSHGSLQN